MKKKRIESIIIATLAFAMVAMSVGFAAYSSKLNISGTTTVSANKWSIEYDPSSVALNELRNGQDFVDIQPSPEGLVQEINFDNANTTISFKAKLQNPVDVRDTNGPTGDLLHFTFKTKNLGSFNAKLNNVKITATDPAIQKIFFIQSTSRLVTNAEDIQDGVHNGTDILVSMPETTHGNFINEIPLTPLKGDYPYILNEVTAYYVMPEDPKDLPEQDLDIIVTIKQNFEQA